MRRFPFTEKFLWDLYAIFEKTHRAYQPFARRTLHDVVNREFYDLRKAYARKKMRKTFSQFLYYLKQKRYIKPSANANGYLLTKKGKDKAFWGLLHNVRGEKRKDGKSLMVIFDIPEKMRAQRSILRNFLYAMGFRKYQQSVWLCANDVLLELGKIIGEYKLERYVKVLLIEVIHNIEELV